MAISSLVARQLCTKAELELFSESLARNIIRLDAKGLKSRIGRARKLRDKYRNLADRQDREARGKQSAKRGNSAQGSAATRKKERLFSETLVRFENRMVKTETAKPAAKEPAAKKSAAKKKSVKKKSVKRKPSAKKPPTKKAVKKKAVKAPTARKPRTPAASKKATTAAKNARRTAAGKTRIEKHRSAQNRRNQAGRDGR